MPNSIETFQGEHRFLSNFYPAVVHMYGFDYPTVEHAFQAAKATNHNDRMRIRNETTPGRAKRAGRTVELRPDWEEFKLSAMLRLIQRKFDPAAHPDLTRKLIATGDALLIEGNHWGDTFWGVDLKTNQGENTLGLILMQVRRELQE